MRCERAQRLMNDALAYGETTLRGEVAAHMRECVVCEKFYEAQRNLFAAIDGGVREMVDVPVPARLLSGQVFEIEAKARRFGSRLSWGFIASAVAAVFIISALVSLRGWRRMPEQEKPVTASQGVTSNPVSVAPPAEVAKTGERTAKVRATRVAARKLEDPSMEVMVPADEREGYEKYIGSVQAGVSEPQKAKNHFEPIEIPPTEIALLKFKDLTVNELSEEADE